MILLVRHGETADNAKRIMQVPEVPLSDLGIRQAELLAERIAQLEICGIVSSDLARAQMTAAIIAERTGAPLELTPLLQERDFGELRGKPYAELTSDPFAPDYVPPGGESWEAFHARVARAFAWIISRQGSERGSLVVISHGLVCAALVRQHLSVADGSVVPGRFDNTSVTSFEPQPPFRARLLNCCAHLRGQSQQSGAPA